MVCQPVKRCPDPCGQHLGSRWRVYLLRDAMCMLSFLECFEIFDECLFVGIGEISPVKVPSVAVPRFRGVIEKECSASVGAVHFNHRRDKAYILPVIYVIAAAKSYRPVLRLVEQVTQGRD